MSWREETLSWNESEDLWIGSIRVSSKLITPTPKDRPIPKPQIRILLVMYAFFCSAYSSQIVIDCYSASIAVPINTYGVASLGA